MDGEHIDTDELSFVINNINEMNIELYKNIYTYINDIVLLIVESLH